MAQDETMSNSQLSKNFDYQTHGGDVGDVHWGNVENVIQPTNHRVTRQLEWNVIREVNLKFNFSTKKSREKFII